MSEAATEVPRQQSTRPANTTETIETSDAPRKPRLRIIFDGVIALGPPHPDPSTGGGERNGPFFGVMALATRRKSDRSRRLGENPPKFIPAHVPTIYTLLEPNGGRAPDHVFQLSKFHPSWNLWHPTRERLEFRFDGDGAPGKLIYDDPSLLSGDAGQGIGAGAVTVRSIDDVPDAREIWPQRAELLPGLLDAATPVRSEANVQILVPRGSICGGGLFEKGKGVEVVFDPPRVAARPRVIVPNVILCVEVEDVEIATYSMDTGEQLDSLKFHLTGDSDLWISNGDPTDTSIDMDRLSKVIAELQQKQADPGLTGVIVQQFKESVSGALNEAFVHAFLNFIRSSGGAAVLGSVAKVSADRISNVDLDFELFYMLEKGMNDLKGLPIPKRADELAFTGPDCYGKLIECPDSLSLKSSERR